MRDIVKDWRRWSRTERIAAILIMSFLMIGVPTAIAINLHSMMQGHSPTRVTS